MSNVENEAILLMSGAIILMASLDKAKRRKRRWWHTNLYKKRNCTELLLDLKSQKLTGQYKNFTRMSPSDFENLLMRIGPGISKQDTHLRASISAQDR